MLTPILEGLALIVIGWSLLAVAALWLVVGVGMGIRALWRRVFARRAAAAAAAQQLAIPVMVDARRGAGRPLR